MPISRRRFNQGIGAAILLRGGPLSAHAAAPQRLTAGEVIERIQRKMAADGIGWESKFPWKPSDGFKYGDSATLVTGVVFTFQATFEVLKKAVQAKANLIITHERMFWDHVDDVGTLQHDNPLEVAGSLEEDPVMRSKRRYCEENGLVVWRFHDHQHMLHPDPVMAGLVRRLGWEQYVVPVDGQMIGFAFVIPEAPLKDVARHVARSLDSQSVRVVGDPNQAVKRIGLGAHKLIELLKPLQSCDVVLMSEAQDCDAFPYMRDAISLGLPHPNGLIAVNHERFEEWGQQDGPAWLRPLVPEVPVTFVSAEDPYWVL